MTLIKHQNQKSSKHSSGKKITEFNIHKAREFLQKKQQKISEKNHKLFLKAWNDFNNIVDMLIKKYNPGRIYQWGSLLNERNFSEISDIDIAVEGIQTAKVFFALYGDAMELTDFSLDLVELEKIDPIHRRSIIKKGKLVYERKKISKRINRRN